MPKQTAAQMIPIAGAICSRQRPVRIALDVVYFCARGVRVELRAISRAPLTALLAPPRQLHLDPDLCRRSHRGCDRLCRCCPEPSGPSLRGSWRTKRCSFPRPPKGGSGSRENRDEITPFGERQGQSPFNSRLSAFQSRACACSTSCMPHARAAQARQESFRRRPSGFNQNESSAARPRAVAQSSAPA